VLEGISTHLARVQLRFLRAQASLRWRGDSALRNSKNTTKTQGRMKFSRC